MANRGNPGPNRNARLTVAQKLLGYHRDYRPESTHDPIAEEAARKGRVRRRIEDILQASRLEDEFDEVWDD
jgi:hypothetical protein